MKIITPRNCICIVILLAFATAASAQSKRFAVFAGYSSEADVTFAPASSIPISLPGLSLNGWNGSVEFRLLRFLEVVGDVAGHYGSYGATLGCEAIVVCVPVGVNVNSDLYSFLAGPQVSASLWRFTPFAHVLLGLAHINQTTNITFVKGLANSDMSFADGIGGGFDLRIVSIVHWRFQGDLIQTRFFSGQSPFNFLTNTQSNFRGSTGVVLRF